jgi:capsular polysaccharide biosynthesis protein
MDVWKLLTALRRRWYLFVPLVVCSIVAALTVGLWVRPEYKAAAVIGISYAPAPQDPQQAAQGRALNPYADMTYSARVLYQVLQSTAVETQLQQHGLTGTLTVQAVAQQVPFVSISAASSDPGQAIATVQGTIQLAKNVLQERQSQTYAAPQDYVGIDILDDADAVVPSRSGQIQAFAAVLGVTGTLSFLVTVVADDILLRRRHRRNEVALRARDETPDPEDPSLSSDDEKTRSAGGAQQRRREPVGAAADDDGRR